MCAGNSIGEDTKVMSMLEGLLKRKLLLGLRPSRAGDVSGVKYSPGMVYSGRRYCCSNGVIAGDIRGVKALCSLTISHVCAFLGRSLTYLVIGSPRIRLVYPPALSLYPHGIIVSPSMHLHTVRGWRDERLSLSVAVRDH